MTAPVLTNYANGLGALTADQLNTFAQTCDTVSQLRNFTGTQGITVVTRGQSSVGDGYGLVYYWSTSSSAIDNGLTVIQPTGGATLGRWVALPSGGTVSTLTLTGALSASSATGILSYGSLSYLDQNIIANFAASANSYVEVVLQNQFAGSTASMDFVVSNNLGTATTYYGNFGMNSSGFTGSGSFNLPNAVYVTATSGDLVLGTTTANIIRFFLASSVTDVAQITSGGITLNFGSTTAAQYTTLDNTGGSRVQTFQQQTSVTTSTTTILGAITYANLVTVYGTDGTNRFTDVLLASSGTATINTISALSCTGSPAARTYTQTAGALKLAMGSGTYTVSVTTTSIYG